MATSLDLPLLKISRVLLVVGFSIQLSSLVFFFRGVMICESNDRVSAHLDFTHSQECELTLV